MSSEHFVIRHGAYHVTRGGFLVFVDKTKGAIPKPVEGWVWLPSVECWNRFFWRCEGRYHSNRVSTWDIVGRWEGTLPAKLPMESRGYYKGQPIFVRGTHYAK